MRRPVTDRVVATTIAAALMLFPRSALAEVMDKEPSAWPIALAALASSALAWVLGRRRPWILWLTLLVGLAYPVALVLEDGSLGGSIMEEGGAGYMATVVAAAVLVIAVHAATLLVWSRQRRNVPGA